MKRLALIALFLLAVACKNKGSKPAAETKTDATAADAEAAVAAGVITVSGFDAPESVLHDATEDVYLVSNVVGSPSGKDDNGFISRVQPDGAVELRWIDGARTDVRLDAPKGMAISGEVLYVTDIDVVRMFDRKTGAPMGEIAVEGATFLDDLAYADGPLWLTDSAAIYQIGADHDVTRVRSGADLGRPNGVVSVSGSECRVVTFGSGEVYNITVKYALLLGDRQSLKVLTTESAELTYAVKLPGGQLDGVVELPDGSLLISSWEAKAVFRLDKSFKATEVVSGVESPADIGFDARRRRVLIPLFTKNTVEIHTLE